MKYELDKQKIGCRIRENREKLVLSNVEREKYGLKSQTKKTFPSQSDFSIMLGVKATKKNPEAGTGKDSVSAWENGKTLPSLTKLLAMCEIFNCEIDYLLHKQDFPEKSRSDVNQITGLSKEAIDELNRLKIKQDKNNERGNYDSTSLQLLNFLLEKKLSATSVVNEITMPENILDKLFTYFDMDLRKHNSRDVLSLDYLFTAPLKDGSIEVSQNSVANKGVETIMGTPMHDIDIVIPVSDLDNMILFSINKHLAELKKDYLEWRDEKWQTSGKSTAKQARHTK
ncbi:MAG: helix-turn-helix domain-containing protein [Defluviitaleaceae bacterium]|nr:helix-turn-helix domain-containing protein [Defluviitaleaceae bacterium]